MIKNIYAVLLCLAPLYTWCQEDRGDSLSTSVLKELVVSANKWEQDINEVSGTIARTSQSLIQFQNPQTSADLLTLSGKVFVQKSQLGGGSPMIRDLNPPDRRGAAAPRKTALPSRRRPRRRP
jgi:hypothetical protein